MNDQVYMAQALRLAEQGLYSAHPNPRVGCVIVAQQQVVGEGWHVRAGEPMRKCTHYVKPVHWRLVPPLMSR